MLPVTGHWDTALTALSVAVSIFTVLVALSVLANASDAFDAAAPVRRRWLVAAGLVFGGGIWAKYVVGLLAFSPDMPARYALAPTMGALILSVLFAGGGFAMLGVVRGLGARLGAAALVAIGILAALRLDMAAIHLRTAPATEMVSFGYASLVAAAIAVSVMWLTARPQPVSVLVLGAVAVGAGVCVTHWFGMQAVGLQGPLMFRDDGEVVASGMVAPDVLATVVAVLVLTLLAVVFVFAAIDRRRTLGLREANEALEARVRERTAELERNAIALSRARDEAVRASKSKDHMLANMSHELRTPLNAILGFSEMMRGELRGPLENAHYKRYAGLIHGSGKHLLGLVNQLLDQSKLEADRVELVAEQVDIGALADECVALVSPEAVKKQISVWTDMEPALIAERTDAAAIRQVLLNLLSNAVKFTDWGGSIAVEIRRAGDMIEIAVSDNGIGIPEESLARVLEPFQQVDPYLSRKYGGAGLGLSISNRLMRLLGGALELRSEMGRGTTATMRLPVSAQRLSRAS